MPSAQPAVTGPIRTVAATVEIPGALTVLQEGGEKLECHDGARGAGPALVLHGQDGIGPQQQRHCSAHTAFLN